MSWSTDYAHSSIFFTARHMMISRVRGEFEKFTATIDYDEAAPEKTSVVVRVDVSSINSREEKRDAHLRSPDFFATDDYPVMTFESKRVELVDESGAKLVGDLTIRDVTKEIVLNVTLEGRALSPWGQEAVGFSATGKLNRKEWGLNWNQALETGGWLVGDEIRIDIELELIRQATPERTMQAD